jgi:hypothetical protein
MTAPVVLISFNRPEATRRTLAAIREATPPELFLLADGPRASNPDDAGRCAAVRRELDAVDWRCEVHRRYRDENAGLDASVETGLDWVFEQAEEAIILEDDCLPNADFFRFCSELLERYRANDAVWQIAGRAANLPPGIAGNTSYAFTAHGPIWGWATWRRAWQTHRRLYPRSHNGTPPPPGLTLDLRESRLLTAGGRRYFSDVARDGAGAGFSWDSYWSLSVVREYGLVVIPSSNLIVNIGFGADATNAISTVPQHPLEPLAWPLQHPAALEVNPALERLFERVLVIYMGRAARVVSRKLRGTRAGAAIRAVVGAWRDRKTRKMVR